MARRRDFLVDKKIGSVIRMQRVNLGISQAELGNALGVTFQQIQKSFQCKQLRPQSPVVQHGTKVFGPWTFRPFAPASREGSLPFQILQNGANDQSSACETIFEVSPTSVLALLGCCQSRLQREWA